MTTAWSTLSGKPYVTVSPVGTAEGYSTNNGADYGPDTSGTASDGVKQAVASGYDVYLIQAPPGQAKNYFSVGETILVNTPGQRIFGSLQVSLNITADIDVIQIDANANDTRGYQLSGIRIENPDTRQTTKAAIHLLNANGNIWQLRLEHIKMNNVFNGITSDPVTASSSNNGIWQLYASDIFIQNFSVQETSSSYAGGQGLVLSNFYDNTWLDLFLNNPSAQVDLTNYNIVLSLGAPNPNPFYSGSWFIRTKILGSSKVTCGRVHSSNVGFFAQDVASLYLTDCLADCWGGSGFLFKGYMDRLRLSGCVASSTGNNGFEVAYGSSSDPTTGTFLFDDCEALENYYDGFLSNTGSYNTSTPVINGGSAVKNTNATVQPTGTLPGQFRVNNLTP